MTIQCTTCKYLDVEPNESPCNHCRNFNMWETQEYRIVEELEKIKHEIGKEFVDLQDGSEEWRSYVNEAVLSCYEIIEKHISEMKGENNADTDRV